jgi:hypothetical protein
MDQKPFRRIEPQALSDSMTVVLTQADGDADVLMCIVDADTGNDVRFWYDEAARLYDVLGIALGRTSHS